MKHRLKAHMVWSSAMIDWALAEMAQRELIAEPINEGQGNEEPKFNQRTIRSGLDDAYDCDLPLGDEANALSAFNQLTALSLIPHLIMTDEVSYVEYHVCYHDEQNQPCEIVHRKEYTNQALSREIINGVPQ